MELKLKVLPGVCLPAPTEAEGGKGMPPAASWLQWFWGSGTRLPTSQHLHADALECCTHGCPELPSTPSIP